MENQTATSVWAAIPAILIIGGVIYAIVKTPKKTQEQLEAEAKKDGETKLKVENYQPIFPDLRKDDKDENFEYKVLPADYKTFPGQQIFSTVENIFNDMYNKGWEYVNHASVVEAIPPGCLGSMFGQRTDYRYHNLFIFRRLKTGNPSTESNPQ